MGDFKQKSMRVEATICKILRNRNILQKYIKYYVDMISVWGYHLAKHSSCGFLAVWAGKWTREVGANPKR